jgi:hypothetical protein
VAVFAALTLLLMRDRLMLFLSYVAPGRFGAVRI